MTGLYRANFWFAISLKTLVYWTEDNRVSRRRLLVAITPTPKSLHHHNFDDIPPTPDITTITDKSLAPSYMQFSPCLPRLLQKIWYVVPSDGPVFLSKWYISDDFH